MTALDADFVIAGAGLSGLALAVHLADAGLGGRRLVLCDPRTTFEDDRTWCGFHMEPHVFSGAVSHRWSRWRVAGPGRDVVRGHPDHPYELVRGADFYRTALARLEREPNVELRLGTPVEDLEDRGDRVVVTTGDGALHARAAFDSRPATARAALAPGPGDVLLLQHFRGWFVRTERPVFEPEVATLMDFRVPQDEGVHFVYVLPTSRHEALVEDTFFSEKPLASETYDATIRAYLDRLDPGDVEVVGDEAGVIPMTTAPFDPRPSPRVYRIGLAAGLAKPSTGYAFLNVMRWSAALAARLRRDALPAPPPVRGHRAAALDRILLSYLKKHPGFGPDFFVDLFEKVPPVVLLRFLTERGTLADCVRVIVASKSLGLSLETVRASPLWLRSP